MSHVQQRKGGESPLIKDNYEHEIVGVKNKIYNLRLYSCSLFAKIKITSHYRILIVLAKIIALAEWPQLVTIRIPHAAIPTMLWHGGRETLRETGTDSFRPASNSLS